MHGTPCYGHKIWNPLCNKQFHTYCMTWGVLGYTMGVVSLLTCSCLGFYPCYALCCGRCPCDNSLIVASPWSGPAPGLLGSKVSLSPPWWLVQRVLTNHRPRSLCVLTAILASPLPWWSCGPAGLNGLLAWRCQWLWTQHPPHPTPNVWTLR